jgi:hypothetical protein
MCRRRFSGGSLWGGTGGARIVAHDRGRSTYVVLTAPDSRSAARGLGVCVKRETANGQRLDHALVQRLI